MFKNVRPHTTRTVKWTQHGVHFPLFEHYIAQNETIDGVEEANALMRRERARRKRLPVPKESKIIEDRLPTAGVPKLKGPKIPAAGGTDVEPAAPEAYTAEDSSSSSSDESSSVDEDDMTLGELKRRKDVEARLICGARAVIHNLTSHHSYNCPLNTYHPADE